MPQVFLSYARKNLPVAKRLYKALSRATNHKIWFDQVSLLPGVRWEPAIRKAIRESRYFLALFSRLSVSAKGYRHSELRQALEVLAEYPSDKIYLIPIRLDRCKMPDVALEALNRVDLFSGWSDGVRSIIKSLGSVRFRAEPRKGFRAKLMPRHSNNRPQFRVALLTMGILSKANLRKVAAGLNSVQDFFDFTVLDATAGAKDIAATATTTIDGRAHFLVDRIASQFFEQSRYLAVDLITSFTDKPLAFRSGDDLNYNYFSYATGPQNRFLFLSSDLLNDMTGLVGQKFADGLAYLLVGILIDFFTDTGYHVATRACPMDHCRKRLDIAYGLNARKLCIQCSKNLTTPGLQRAVNSMLKWRA